jgi:hypothetical protein
MKRLLAAWVLCGVLAISSTAAFAEERTASNGVTVTVEGDEFKPSTDYSGPFMRTGEGGYVVAIRKTNSSGATVFIVQGFVIYNTDWRFYDRAYLPGGREVKFTSLGREVGRCSRYGGCTHSENYQLTFTSEQIAEGLKSGDLRVQIGSKSNSEFVISIDPAQVRAVAEVAGVKIASSGAAL